MGLLEPGGWGHLHAGCHDGTREVEAPDEEELVQVQQEPDLKEAGHVCARGRDHACLPAADHQQGRTG